MAGQSGKVLWFTNIELPAVRRRLASPEVGGGGWMDSLRAALLAEGSVRLGVAAAGTTPFEPFDEDGVRYYHMAFPPDAGRLAGIAARWRHPTHEKSLLAQAITALDRFQPDLIHVHGSEGPFGLLAGTIPTPGLVSLQGVLLAYSRAYFSGIPIGDIVRGLATSEFVKGRGFIHAHANMRVAARRELGILRTCQSFAGRTEWDRGIISVVNPRAHYYHAEEVLRPEFRLSRWESPTGATFVVYATGGPAPYKGLISLLEAVALLRQSAQSDIRVRISGQIRDTSMWPVVQRAVDRWQLHAVVEWLGPLTAQGVVSELRSSSVYVHPSVADNSPNSLAEAMMVGAPCVASSAGGIPSLLEDGQEGLLCPPNDVYGLAGAIRTVAANPALAAQLGERARVRALRRHDPTTIAEATVAMYEDIISRHRGCRS
jgi:glycosyltransferase involved in cell wall biosynthesis